MNLRDELVPVAGRLKLILKVTAERRVELLLRYELEQVGVEAHLVSGHRVKERRNTFVEKVEDEGKINHERTAESLDIMLLKNCQGLRYRVSVSVRHRNGEGTNLTSNGNRRVRP